MSWSTPGQVSIVLERSSHFWSGRVCNSVYKPILSIKPLSTAATEELCSQVSYSCVECMIVFLNIYYIFYNLGRT